MLLSSLKLANSLTEVFELKITRHDVAPGFHMLLAYYTQEITRPSDAKSDGYHVHLLHGVDRALLPKNAQSWMMFFRVQYRIRFC